MNDILSQFTTTSETLKDLPPNAQQASLDHWAARIRLGLMNEGQASPEVTYMLYGYLIGCGFEPSNDPNVQNNHERIVLGA